MNGTREELIQQLLEKQENFFRGMHRGHFFRRFGKHRHLFQDLGLSRSLIFLLMIISRSDDGISVKDLSMKFFVSSGAITQLIDTLIEKKLVTREEDLNDRRVIRIKLTDYAKDKLSNFKKGLIGNITHIFDNLTDDELKEFIRLTDKLKSPLEDNTD